MARKVVVGVILPVAIGAGEGMSLGKEEDECQVPSRFLLPCIFNPFLLPHICLDPPSDCCYSPIATIPSPPFPISALSSYKLLCLQPFAETVLPLPLWPPLPLSVPSVWTRFKPSVSFIPHSYSETSASLQSFNTTPMQLSLQLSASH